MSNVTSNKGILSVLAVVAATGGIVYYRAQRQASTEQKSAEKSEKVDKDKRVLIHNNFHGRWSLPSIQSPNFSVLAEGWTEEMIANLPKAVENMIDRNPILKARLLPKESAASKCMHVEMGYFEISKSGAPFCFIHDLRDKVEESPKGLKRYAAFDYLKKYIRPQVKELVYQGRESLSSANEMEERLPLFRMDLFRLPDGMVAYKASSSHVLGDHYNFYRLVGQVSEELTDLCNAAKGIPPVTPKQELEWLESSTITFDEVFSDRRAFFSRLLHDIYMGTQAPVQTKYFILDQNKIKEQKKALLKEGVAYLTTNDIITAALCEEFHEKCDIVQTVYDLRGRRPNLHTDSAGYFTTSRPGPVQKMRDPNEVRKATEKEGYYNNSSESIPYWSYVKGRSFEISNFVGGYQVIEAPNVSNTCLSDNDYRNFVRVFRVSDTDIGIGISIGTDGFESPMPGRLLSKLVID